MQDNDNLKEESGGSSIISVKNIMYAVFSRWYWFALSLIICLGLGYYKIKKTEPVFSSSAQLLLKDEDQGNSSGDLTGTFSGIDRKSVV